MRPKRPDCSILANIYGPKQVGADQVILAEQGQRYPFFYGDPPEPWGGEPPSLRKQGPVPVLNLNGGDERQAEMITLALGLDCTNEVIAGIEGTPARANVVATIEWGQGAASQIAYCDFRWGQVLSLAASSLRVSAGYAENPFELERGDQIVYPKVTARATVTYGTRSGGEAPTLTYPQGTVRAASEETAEQRLRYRVPPFASRFAVVYAIPTTENIPNLAWTLTGRPGDGQIVSSGTGSDFLTGLRANQSFCLTESARFLEIYPGGEDYSGQTDLTVVWFLCL